jgi:bifunctional DNase/RNase
VDDQNDLIEVTLAKIVIRERSPEQYIYLKEKNGDRLFPIVIGIFEAIAINREIKGESPERPMTHDLLSSVIDSMGATLERIVVTELKGDTFHANLILITDGRMVRVDSRPSDAIALAVRQDARIFVSESVLNSVSASQDLSGPDVI